MLRASTNNGNSYVSTGDFTHLPEELEVENEGRLLADLDEYISGTKLLKLILKRSRTNVVISRDPALWNRCPKAPKYLE